MCSTAAQDLKIIFDTFSWNMLIPSLEDGLYLLCLLGNGSRPLFHRTALDALGHNKTSNVSTSLLPVFSMYGI
jgi:hypothetical protein